MKFSPSVKNAIYLGSLCSVAYFAVYIARNILSAVTPQMVADGFTEDYQKGGFATTRIESSGVKDGRLTMTVYPRKGGFDGRPENGHDIMKNSIPKISPMAPQGDMEVLLHTKRPVTGVTLGGQQIAFSTCPEGILFTVDATRHASETLAYEISLA